jgi:hypothetical protein
VIDLIGGQAIGADEAQHLVALAGAALLVWQSRERDTESAAPAIVPGEGPVATPAERDEAAPVTRLDRASGHPWGGDAARTTAPGVAAQATSVPSDAAAATAADPEDREAESGPAAGHDEAVA